MSSLEQVDRELDRRLSTELLLDWFRHPVTKAILIVAAAEFAYQMLLHIGFRLAGTGDGQDA